MPAAASPAGAPAHLVRLVGRQVAPALARKLVPGLVLLLGALAWLWIALPIREIQGAAARQGPLAAATTSLVVLGLHALVLGPRLRIPLLGPGLAWLRRQPLGPTAWSLALGPWLLAVAAPAALPALLWPWAWPLLGAVAWGSASILLLLGVLGGPRHALPGAGLVAAAFAVLLVSRLGPAGLLLGAGLGTGAVALLAGRWTLRLAATPSDPVLPFPLHPKGPLAALVHRDVLALLRRAPGLLGAALLVPLVPVALLVPFRAAGQLSPAGLALAGRVLLALASVSVLLVVGRVADLLGPALDPPQAPVSPRLRALSLVLLGAAVHAPALGLALAALGSLANAATSAALVPGAVLLATWSRGREARPPNVGGFLLLATGIVLLASLPGGAGATLAVAAVAFGGTARRLHLLRGSRT